MRKFAWLTLVATAALFVSAQDGAFAHAAHHHVQQTQNAPAPAQNIAPAAEQVPQTEVNVSAAFHDFGKCPHKHEQGDCSSCCACAGGASVALAAPEWHGGSFSLRSERTAHVVRHEMRHAILDLNRPPKSFA